MKTKILISVFITLVLLLTDLDLQAQLQCELTEDPYAVELITTDICNFITVLDLLELGKDTLVVLQEQYFEKATPGLKEFINSRELTAEHFLNAIRKRSEMYKNLRNLPDALNKLDEQVRLSYKKLKQIIPTVVFMPAYYMVSNSSGGFGEPSEYGLMIALGELDEDINKIDQLLVHETIHVQQALTIGMEEYQLIFGPKRSLLALCIREGVATYLTYLTTGEYSDKKAYEYYLKHENELWEQFLKDNESDDPGEWLWTNPKDPGKPRDLGYIVGARIAESYYENSENKSQAINDILSVIDYEAFLDKSGYSVKR